MPTHTLASCNAAHVDMFTGFSVEKTQLGPVFFCRSLDVDGKMMISFAASMSERNK